MLKSLSEASPGTLEGQTFVPELLEIRASFCDERRSLWGVMKVGGQGMVVTLGEGDCKAVRSGVFWVCFEGGFPGFPDVIVKERGVRDWVRTLA